MAVAHEECAPRTYHRPPLLRADASHPKWGFAAARENATEPDDRSSSPLVDDIEAALISKITGADECMTIDTKVQFSDASPAHYRPNFTVMRSTIPVLRVTTEEPRCQ